MLPHKTSHLRTLVLLLASWHLPVASARPQDDRSDQCASKGPLCGTSREPHDQTSLIQSFHEVWQAHPRAEGAQVLREPTEDAAPWARTDFATRLEDVEAFDHSSLMATTMQSGAGQQVAAQSKALGAQRAAMVTLTEEQIELVRRQEQLHKQLDELNATTMQQGATWATVATEVAQLLAGRQPAKTTGTSNAMVMTAAGTSNATVNAKQMVQEDNIVFKFLGPLGAAAYWLKELVVHLVKLVVDFFGGLFGSFGSLVSGGIGGSMSTDTSGWWAKLWPPLYCSAVFAFIGSCSSRLLGAAVGGGIGVVLGIFFVITGQGHQFYACFVYLVLMGIIGHIYKYAFSYRFPPLRHAPEPNQESFSFGLFEGCSGDPDFRVCLCSFLCMPARWADTASAQNITLGPGFWSSLFVFSALSYYATEAYGIPAVVLLLWLVANRQRIRQVYGLRWGTPSTVAQDCCIHLWCSPCATMQEALQAEFIDMPPPSFPQPKGAGGKAERPDAPPGPTGGDEARPGPGAPGEDALMGSR